MILPLGKPPAYVMEEVLGSIPSEALFTSYFWGGKAGIIVYINGRFNLDPGTIIFEFERTIIKNPV